MSNKITVLFFGLIIIMTGFLLSGCDGSSDIIDPPTPYDYTISGALVVDNNTASVINDSTRIAVRLTRNNSALNSADVIIADDTLTYNFIPNCSTLGYTFSSNPGGTLSAGNYQLNIIDSTLFDQNISLVLPAFPTVSAYNPDSTTTYNPNNGVITFEWTSSQTVEGYIIAAVLANDTYSKVGYSAYVTSQGTSDTFPPDAFSSAGTGNIIPGDYYLYVYGFTGAPDSALSSSLLPVPLPSQLPANLDLQRIGGNIGTVVISRRVPITVIDG